MECEVVQGNYAKRVAEGLFARIGTDAFETEVEAVRDAVRRAEKKLVSLEGTRDFVEMKLAGWKAALAVADNNGT